MYEEIFIPVYALAMIGYTIEIYHLFKFGDDKNTNTCLWTTNGGSFIFAMVYCYFNQYTYLMWLFVIHYACCFVCLCLNIYFVYFMGTKRVYTLEPDTLPPLPSSFGRDIELKPMSNPLYEKRRGDENV
jgi:peptidoglycan/LPS O-acetylase OafA/YrhL